MKSTFDILDKLYKIINVSGVTSTLDGRVYRDKKPLNDEKRNVVIVPLPIRNGDGFDVQPGTVVINCYAANLSNGMPDTINLDAMTSAVIAAIENYNDATSDYFRLQIISQNTMQDQDNNKMSYSSLRINILIEN